MSLLRRAPKSLFVSLGVIFVVSCLVLAVLPSSRERATAEQQSSIRARKHFLLPQGIPGGLKTELYQNPSGTERLRKVELHLVVKPPAKSSAKGSSKFPPGVFRTWNRANVTVLHLKVDLADPMWHKVLVRMYELSSRGSHVGAENLIQAAGNGIAPAHLLTIYPSPKLPKGTKSRVPSEGELKNEQEALSAAGLDRTVEFYLVDRTGYFDQTTAPGGLSDWETLRALQNPDVKL